MNDPIWAEEPSRSAPPRSWSKENPHIVAFVAAAVALYFTVGDFVHGNLWGILLLALTLYLVFAGVRTVRKKRKALEPPVE